MDGGAKIYNPIYESACYIEMNNLSIGNHTIKATYFNDVNGIRTESVYSMPLDFNVQ